jgi:hypothetical protein
MACLILVGIGVVLGCSDAPTTAPRSTAQIQDGASLCSDDPRTCTPNPYDSWASVDATLATTVTLTLPGDSPAYDPSTGQMTTTLTLTIPAASMHAEMGYDAPTGRTIGWVHSYDAEGDPTRIVDFRSVDDEFVEYDGAGGMAPAASLYDEPLQYASLVQTTPYNALVGPPLSGNDCPENKPNCGPPLEQSKNLLGARIVDGTGAVETSGSLGQAPTQAPSDQPSVAELERAYGASATFSRLGNGHVSVRRVLSGQAAATPAVDLGSSLTRTDGSTAPYTVTEEYRPDRGRWVRHSVVTERDATIDGRRAHSVTRLTYRNVQWRANPVQDSLRALRRRAGASPSAPGLRARVVAAAQRGSAVAPSPASPASPQRASGTLASIATPSRNTAANLIPWLRYCGPPICFIGAPPPVPPPPPPPGYYGYPDPQGAMKSSRTLDPWSCSNTAL